VKSAREKEERRREEEGKGISKQESLASITKNVEKDVLTVI